MVARIYEIRDLKTDALLLRGVGLVAEDVYGDYCRLYGIERPQPKLEDYEDPDPKMRKKAFGLLKRQDTWIDDPDIYMKMVEEKR